MATTNGDLRAQLREVEVTEVEETGKELGKGAYGVVKEIKVKGHRCAGKKLHETFFIESSSKEQQSITARFAQECLGHSKLHHPNIIHLIGVYFSPRNRAPTLIMELMHHSLTQALEQYPSMASHVKNIVLLDVTYGLHFLHDRTPPIIHRDLTANNILLSESMRAKIADLGQAKIVTTGPMSETPGNPAYMPPESFTDNPVYDAKLDMFSFGALIIHTSIHDWPFPKGLFRSDPASHGRSIPLTEIERRAHYLERMGEGNPLTNMATRCLQNDPPLRPTAAEVIRELEGIIRNNPPPANMLPEISTKTERIQTLNAEKQALVSDHPAEEVAVKTTVVERLNKLISSKTERIQTLVSEKQALVSNHAAEVDGLNGQIEALEGRVESLEGDKQALEVAMTHKQAVIDEGQQETTRLRENLRTKDTELANQRERICTREEEVAVKAAAVKALNKEVSSKTERIRTLVSEKQALVSDHAAEVEGLNGQIEALEGEKHALDEGQREITRLRENLRTKDTEIANQRERICTREEEVAVKAAAVKALNKEVSSRTERIRTLVSEKQALVSNHAAEVEGLQRRVESLEGDKQALEVNVTRKQAVIDEGQQETTLKALNKEVSSKTERIRTLVSEKQALISNHAAEVEGLNGQIEALEGEKQALEVNVTRKQAVINEGQREITRLRENLRTKDAEIANQRERVRTREEEVAVKAAAVKALNKEVSSRTERIRTLVSEKQALISDRAAEVEGLNGKIEALEGRVESLEGDKQALEVNVTRKQAVIDEGQQETTRLREDLRTKDTELAIQRERNRTREEEVAVKAKEIKALLQSRDTTAVVSSHSSPARMVSFNVRNCNVLVLGKTGAGKSAVCNQILGTECFHSSPGYTGAVTKAACHAVVTIQGQDNITYHVKVIDTLGFFNYKLNNDDVLKDIKTYMRDRVPEGVSLVLFVVRNGRLTPDEREPFEIIMKRFSGISPVSALVLTHCEDHTEGGRKDLIQDFCTNQSSAGVAKFMQKGIYPVGFPDLSTMSPRLAPLYKEDMAADAKTLCNLVFRGTDMLPSKNIFVRTFFRK